MQTKAVAMMNRTSQTADSGLVECNRFSNHYYRADAVIFNCGTSATLALSREALESDKFDMVLLDIGLPDGSGLDLLEIIEKMQGHHRWSCFPPMTLVRNTQVKSVRHWSSQKPIIENYPGQLLMP